MSAKGLRIDLTPIFRNGKPIALKKHFKIHFDMNRVYFTPSTKDDYDFRMEKKESWEKMLWYVHTRIIKTLDDSPKMQIALKTLQAARRLEGGYGGRNKLLRNCIKDMMYKKGLYTEPRK